MALTNTWLRANHRKEFDGAFERADRDGLSVRVSAKGKVVFQLRYRYLSKPKRLTLGTYPGLSLKEAREEAARLRHELEQGRDPQVVKRTEIKLTQEADEQTTEKLIRLWFDKEGSRKKEAGQMLRSFELHVFPRIGNVPTKDVTLHHWLSLLEDLAKRLPGIADRVLVCTKQALSFGVRRRLIADNVLAAITAKRDLGIESKPRDRSLSDSEIALLLACFEGSRMALKNRIFLLLCLIYGCRNGELRLARKSDFDLQDEVWTVPKENHKIGASTGRALYRPITDEIRPLIELAATLSDGEYLFSNAGSNAPMGRSAPLSLPYNVMQWVRKNKGVEMEHWSVHDLRRTARTAFATVTEPHIGEILLGHKLPGEWMTYDQHHYLEEQAAALEAWIRRLKTLGAFPAAPIG